MSNKVAMLGLLSGALCCLYGLPVEATQLPPGVLGYVHQKDPKAQVRFDGVVTFSNGTAYLPIIPQAVNVNPDPTGVISTMPDKAQYPDLVHFDNHFFLIKLIQTSSGRLTLPKLSPVPIELKEGLLPQDLVMPNHLYIPDELKIILGELPYSPSLETASPKITAAQVIQKEKPVPIEGSTAPIQANQKMLFAYDMDGQLLVQIDLFHQKAINPISLGCMPASMTPSADNKQMYVGCLSDNDLLVVDLSAGLIKTRIPMGGKPDDVLLLPQVGYLVVSNRFQNYISLISTTDLLPAQAEFQVKLPGKPGVLSRLSETEILVADAYSNQVYQVDLKTRQVTRTLTALKNISAMLLHQPANARPELWVVSRSENKVQVLDYGNGTPLATLDVGAKPIAIGLLSQIKPTQVINGMSPVTAPSSGAAENTATSKTTEMYVLSAGNERIDVIDPIRYTVDASIPLPAGIYPTAMAIAVEDQRAYISGAGKNGLAVVALARHQLDAPVELPFRTFALAIPKTGPIPVIAKNKPPVTELPALGTQPVIPQATSLKAEDKAEILQFDADPSEKSSASAQKTQLLKDKKKPDTAAAKAAQANEADLSSPEAVSPAVMPSNLSIPDSNTNGVQLRRAAQVEQEIQKTEAAVEETTAPKKKWFQRWGKNKSENVQNAKPNASRPDLPILELDAEPKNTEPLSKP